MFDINSIEEHTAQKLQLLHPQTQTPVTAYIELAGAGHPKRRKIELQRARDLRARIAKRGRVELTDPVEDEEYELDRLVACTLSWEGICRGRDKVPIPCTPEEARKLYEEADWVRKQVAAFLDDAANFLTSTDGA